MAATPGSIVRRGGISRTVFIISLIIVGAGSGLTGYFLPGILHPSPAGITLNGAGSTFVYPLISAMDANYSKINSNIQINYQAVGSGTGINFLSAHTVDFGASDAPLTDTQLSGISNALTIPDTVGAVVVGYNLPGITTALRLNATVIAAIFEGTLAAPGYQITNWNQTAIRQLNPGVNLPNQGITIVHRSESSGTTFVFSGYLNTTYPVWTLNQAKSIGWPTSSIGANGNQGVAAVVQGTKYSIGYVELNYALSATPRIPYALVYNPNGSGCTVSMSSCYINATLASTAKAVSSLPSTYLPAGDASRSWQPINLLNSNDPAAYPIVTFSYIMVFKELNVESSMTQSRAQALVSYLWFVVHAGQNQSGPLYYVPLPSNVVANAEASIRLITFNGAALNIPS